MTWRDVWRMTFGNEGGFGGGSVPKAPPPPPPPKIEDPNVQEAAAKERRRLRGAKGRGSTLLAGDTLGAPSTLGGTPAA